jgi:hypothetical protein
VAGGWRRLHDEIRNSYSSPDTSIIRVIKSREVEMGGACAMHGRDEKCVQNFDRKTRRENIGVYGG